MIHNVTFFKVIHNDIEPHLCVINIDTDLDRQLLNHEMISGYYQSNPRCIFSHYVDYYSHNGVLANTSQIRPQALHII